mmetsp:Transcript_8828/g.21489  ORF Transcript_8828/g.21489 Transcript_8828/m.21489 type:complete len:115 (+) Transcript_8828:2565-2909(+)
MGFLSEVLSQNYAELFAANFLTPPPVSKRLGTMPGVGEAQGQRGLIVGQQGHQNYSHRSRRGATAFCCVDDSGTEICNAQGQLQKCRDIAGASVRSTPCTNQSLPKCADYHASS